MAAKKARTVESPSRDRIPRTKEDVNKIGLEPFRWRVNNKYVDYNHEEWGWDKLSCKDFFKILTDRLHEFEQMTWNDLSRRKSCHPMPIENIESNAQQRLCEVCGNEIDSLYQVDISPQCRLWGYRNKTTFYLIWHDPNHTVYRVS